MAGLFIIEARSGIPPPIPGKPGLFEDIENGSATSKKSREEGGSKNAHSTRSTSTRTPRRRLTPTNTPLLRLRCGKLTLSSSKRALHRRVVRVQLEALLVRLDSFLVLADGEEGVTQTGVGFAEGGVDDQGLTGVGNGGFVVGDLGVGGSAVYGCRGGKLRAGEGKREREGEKDAPVAPENGVRSVLLDRDTVRLDSAGVVLLSHQLVPLALGSISFLLVFGSDLLRGGDRSGRGGFFGGDLWEGRGELVRRKGRSNSPAYGVEESGERLGYGVSLLVLLRVGSDTEGLRDALNSDCEHTGRVSVALERLRGETRAPSMDSLSSDLIAPPATLCSRKERTENAARLVEVADIVVGVSGERKREKRRKLMER